MAQSIEKVMQRYTEAYHNLYQRSPTGLRALDDEWIVVNGARMRITELEYLTQQLQQEYDQLMSQRRGIVNRLIKWFKSS